MLLIENKALLESFKVGDRDAMSAVYNHYVRGVANFLQKGFAFRSGTTHYFFKGFRERADLHNSTQEVFRRAFENKARQSYNGVNSFSNWLLAIARNLVINQFRNREVAFSQFEEQDGAAAEKFLTREVSEEYSGLLYGRPSDKQDVALEHAQLKDLLDRFMGDLTEDERMLIKLRFAEGRGQEETAEAMGSTRMKVRTVESKVRDRLRKYLRNTGYLDAIAKAQEPVRRAAVA